MSSTEATIEYVREGDFVDELTRTPTGKNKPSRISPFRAYRILSISLSDGQLANNGTDTEKVTVEVVDGLEVARGTDPSNATVLDYNGGVTLSVDGRQTTKTLTNGSVSFDLNTTKSAGSEIEIVAESLATHPAESDSATIAVMSQ